LYEIIAKIRPGSCCLDSRLQERIPERVTAYTAADVQEVDDKLFKAAPVVEVKGLKKSSGTTF
jgi:hypothetical protein